MKSLKTSLIAAGFLAAVYTQAGTITCNDSYRTATVSNATSCFAQSLGSTAKAGDLQTITGSSWSMVGELTASGTSSNGWFTITGSGWGSGSATGTWSISDLFWDNFASAMITMHVGGGQKNAVDNFEWLITPDSASGIFSYLKTNGKGGGLSNFKLWGMGTPVKTEPTPAPAPATPAPADPAPAAPAPANPAPAADPAPATPAPADPQPAAPAPTDPAPASPAPADPQPAAPAPADPAPAAPAPAADPVPSEPTPAPTPLPPNPDPVVSEPEPNPVPPPVFEPETPLPPTTEPTVPAPALSVPEPTPWMLMLLGAMMITLLRRRPAKR